MYVGRIMHRNLITITPDASLNDAIDITQTHNIQHLIVLDAAGKLAGIVSSHDIKRTLASPATTLSTHELNYLLDKVTVGSFMTRKVLTVPPDTTVERAAYIMQTNKIRALPVMKDDRLVGIVTTTDVMGVLLDALGMSEDTQRLIVLVKDRIGTIAEVTSVLRDNAVNIQSLVTWPEKEGDHMIQLVLRVRADDGDKAVESLGRAGIKVLTGYVEDYTPYYN
ncbi:CBS and ACT domain-containing protein [Desulfatiferula olefinivorans]